ncbi:MAG: hypothetical protein GY810_13325 [Aureispira sp.]|nr:hypothetical protein [Aureispira sp.]
MELLDNQNKDFLKKKAEHKILYYLIYSLSLFLVVLGALSLVKGGHLDDDTLFNSELFVAWLSIYFVCTLLFYRKVITSSWWFVVWAVAGFVAGFFLAGYMVDVWFDTGRDQPLLSGILIYLGYWIGTLLLPVGHYIYSKAK